MQLLQNERFYRHAAIETRVADTPFGTEALQVVTKSLVFTPILRERFLIHRNGSRFACLGIF